jgi:DNA-binding MarR family transcriptional regulator
MDSPPSGGGDKAGRQRRAQEIRDALRTVNSQLSLLSQRVGGHLELRGTDFLCLDLIGLHGALSPSALARLSGLHPATMTGVIDRLERDGWITRDRDPDDRRGVVLHPVAGRRADVLRLFAGMTTRMAEVCADYSDAELALIAGFLRRTAEAGSAAVAQLDAD